MFDVERNYHIQEQLAHMRKYYMVSSANIIPWRADGSSFSVMPPCICDGDGTVLDFCISERGATTFQSMSLSLPSCLAFCHEMPKKRHT